MTAYVVLGVNRRDLLLIATSTDLEEANAAAEAGVMESKFSQTFVFQSLTEYHEAAVNWANPDGVSHKPAPAAHLNPETPSEEGEPAPAAPPTTKTAQSQKVAEAQLSSGAAVNTGEPDKINAAKDGKTSAFDGKPSK